MNINIKLNNKKAKIPEYAKYGDACVDLYAVDMKIVYRPDHGHYEENIIECEGSDSKKYTRNGPILYIEYELGLSMEIPEGYVGLCFPRSSISEMDLVLANSVGVIDSGYRNTFKARFKPYSGDPFITPKNFYKIGDRVCQLLIIPYPTLAFIEVNKLSDSERGLGGFGSTNKK